MARQPHARGWLGTTKRPAPTGGGQERLLCGGPSKGRAMTDTTTPNGDRDRPSDREAAKNPRGPATGPPEGTASSGSTSPQLDMAAARAGRRVRLLPGQRQARGPRAHPCPMAEHDRWCATAETSSLTCDQLAHSYPQASGQNERESGGRKHPRAIAIPTFTARALGAGTPLVSNNSGPFVAFALKHPKSEVARRGVWPMSTLRRSGRSRRRRRRTPRCRTLADRPCGSLISMRMGVRAGDDDRRAEAA